MVKQRKAGTARSRAPAIPPADVGIVEQELRRHGRLERHRVVAEGRQLIVQEPLTGFGAEFAERAALHGLTPERLAATLRPPRFAPVLRFVVVGGGEYRVERMTYRGEGAGRTRSTAGASARSPRSTSQCWGPRRGGGCGRSSTAPSGSPTPSRPSPGPSRCTNTSGGTPTASACRTNASSAPPPTPSPSAPGASRPPRCTRTNFFAASCSTCCPTAS